MAGHNAARTAALLAATLIALLGVWFAGQYLFGLRSGPSNSVNAARAALPLVLGLVTLALVVLALARRRRMPPASRPRWLLFAIAAIAGYLVARDAFSYSLYLSRPGGLPGGCYTQLEVWLRVPRESWIRDLEQFAAMALFFASPLFLLAGRLPHKEYEADGA
jgi:hypothetical protein